MFRIRFIVKSFTLSTRTLSVIRSVRISAVSMTSEETRAELDSHADTCVVGKAAWSYMTTIDRFK